MIIDEQPGPMRGLIVDNPHHSIECITVALGSKVTSGCVLSLDPATGEYAPPDVSAGGYAGVAAVAIADVNATDAAMEVAAIVRGTARYLPSCVKWPEGAATADIEAGTAALEAVNGGIITVIES